MLGRPVAEQLKRDDFDITVMSSNVDRARTILGEEFDLTYGNVTDKESLKKPIEGKDFIYINLSARLVPEMYQKIEIDGTTNVAATAVEMAVKRIGLISGASVTQGQKGIIYADAKMEAEKAVMESGVAYTIMRPSWFFESLPFFVQKGRAAVIGKKQVKFSWLAASDYARQVSNAFQKEEAANKCFYSLGPQKMTMLEALTKFCSRHYPDIKPQVIGFTMAKIMSKLPGAEMLKLAVPFFMYFSRITEDVNPSEADRILGPNLTTIDEWLARWEEPELKDIL